MKLNNRGRVGTTILIVILAIGFLGCAGYIVYDKVISKDEPIEEKASPVTTDDTTETDSKTTQEQQSTTNNETDTVTTKELTDSDKISIATNLFKEYMNQYKAGGSKYDTAIYDRIKDYSLVDIIVKEAPADYELNEGDFVVHITYNVTPEDINTSAWVAGNGEIQNNMIVNKMHFYHIGKQNGEYAIINIFTGF